MTRFSDLARRLPPAAQRLALAGCAPCVRDAYRAAWEAERRQATAKALEKQAQR